MGFTDRDHIIKDSDLKSLRETEEYKNIISELKPLKKPAF